MDTNRADPATDVGQFITKVLSPPSSGMGGGSAMEERAQDSWKSGCRHELAYLRREYGPPSRAPELHAFLDVAERILR
jgi:hypothetical protein